MHRSHDALISTYINANCILERILRREAIEILGGLEFCQDLELRGSEQNLDEELALKLETLGEQFLSNGECDLMHILGLPATETPTSAQKLLGNLDFNQSPKALYEQISTIAPWSNRLIAAIADYENVAGEHAFNVLSVLAGRIEEHYAENFSLPPGALGKATRQFLDTVRQIHSSVTHRI